MKSTKLKSLLLELDSVPEQPSKTKLKGTINAVNIQKLLGNNDYDPNLLTKLITAARTNTDPKAVDIRVKEFALKLLIALIKTDEDRLLAQIFSNLRSIKTDSE